MSRPLHVLVVCTGNICRSPMAERLLVTGLRQRCGPAGPAAVHVSSAGTWGHEGDPMDPFAETALRELGADPDDFRARELTAAMLADADVVLAATRDHRAAAAVLLPEAAAYTYTLRELARLTRAVDPARLPPPHDLAARTRYLLALAAQVRGEPSLRARRPQDDDVDDPYGAPASVFRQCAALLHEELTGPLDLIAGVKTGRRAGR